MPQNPQTRLLAVAVTLSLGAGSASAQPPSGFGRTPQGDALHAQGRFLRGMAWYELGTAQAAAIDQQALEAWNRSIQAAYAQDLADRARRLAARRSAVNARVAKVEQKLAETQRRWRENPTLEEIRSGLALNALALDLADPRIPEPSWSQARVDLPKELELRSLVFRFADAPRFKSAPDLRPSVVAIGRMTLGEGWPVALRRPELKPQRDGYERAVRAAVARCRQRQPLQAADVDGLRDALQRLRDDADRFVPTGRLSRQAADFLNRLDEATRLFLDQEFAEELIRDVETHRAATVRELLGFMKKYRLLFADGGEDPNVWGAYERLYRLLKDQKLALTFADAAEQAEAEKKAAEAQKALDPAP